MLQKIIGCTYILEILFGLEAKNQNANPNKGQPRSQRAKNPLKTCAGLFALLLSFL